jgi:hypothetical protein
MNALSRHVGAPRAGRLTQKELAIAGRGFRILVDGDDDRLMPETPAEKYRREAEACCLKGEEATNSVDKQAWQQLAADWTKLARCADLNQEWQTMQVRRRQNGVIDTLSFAPAACDHC